MIHTRTKYIALLALIFCGASLSVYAVFSWYISTMKADLFASRLMAAESEMQTRAYNSLQATIASSKEDREKLSELILKKEDLIDFLNEISVIGKEQGVQLTTQNIEASSIDDTFEALNVDVTINGSFDAVMRTIRILETLPVQSQVESVSVGRGEGLGAWSATVDFSVTSYKAP